MDTPNDPIPQITVGDVFGPTEIHISAELNEQYLFAFRDYSPLFVGTSAGPGYVHPGCLINLTMTGYANFTPARGWTGLHARDELEMHSPVIVGETVRLTWTVDSKEERRGRPWWSRTCVMRDAATDELRLTRRMHTAFVPSVAGDVG